MSSAPARVVRFRMAPGPRIPEELRGAVETEPLRRLLGADARVQISERGCESRQVLRVGRRRDVEVHGHPRITVQNRGHPPDQDETDLLPMKRREQRFRVERRFTHRAARPCGTVRGVQSARRGRPRTDARRGSAGASPRRASGSRNPARRGGSGSRSRRRARAVRPSPSKEFARRTRCGRQWTGELPRGAPVRPG